VVEAGSRWALFAIGFAGLTRFTDVNSTLEERAVFNRNSRRDDIAGERTIAANIHAIASGQVAANFAEDNDLAGIDIGGDNAVASNGDAISGQIDRAFHAAINIERFGPGDFTLNDK